MLSQSKAGIISCFLLVTYYIFIRSPLLRTFINPKKIIRFSITMIFLAGLVLGVTYKVAYNYYDDLNNVDDVLASRINDTSFVMGRIAATHIGPNIISDNPVAGVGLGAYSLVRNNIQYRQQFPFVSGWDLTGLGGLTTLAIENGFLGLGIFLFATLLYFSFNLLGGYFILLFLFPFVLGAQLYMVYPWFYLGLYACLRKKR
ncbi:Lipid A core - O-antigen ligase and related enzymes [Shimwellia blattae]|nr:O-antigen ligase family protein [Shimwellia blattae]VEC20302.1 Lipid A core - O-antigen ligase and related enzymes [Shimwellia blattae]